MKKISMLMIFVIILCTILTGCSKATATQKSYKYFAEPNKIVFYNNGKETTFKKGSDSFNKILELTDKRFGEQVDFYSMVIDMKDLNPMNQNEMMLEFTYSENVETKYQLAQPFSKKYNKLLMPLNGKYTNCMFFDNGDVVSSGPIATLSAPDDLIKILK